MKLDGAGDLVSVDPIALLGTIAKDNIEILDPDDALRLARRFGAGRATMGRVTKIGEEIQLSVSVYREPEIPEIEAVSIITGEAGITAGLDDLALKIARELYDEPPEGVLSLGSTFALAWARLGWSAGWAVDVDLEQEGLRQAMRYRGASRQIARRDSEKNRLEEVRRWLDGVDRCEEPSLLDLQSHCISCEDPMTEEEYLYLCYKAELAGASKPARARATSDSTISRPSVSEPLRDRCPWS